MKFKGTKGLKILSYNEIGFGLGVDSDNVKLTIWGNNNEAKANALLISNAPEFLEEIQDTIDDLKLLKSTILDASKINNKLESVVEVIQNWIDRKEQLIKEATKL